MKKVIGALFLSFIMITTFSFAAYPADLEAAELEALKNAGEEIELLSEQPVDEAKMIMDDVYKMEEEVTINENIDGNVYVMARTIKIENVVIYGNLYAMAEKIEIADSEIDGSIYLLGEEVNFSGKAYDVYACGSKINFDSESYIWRNVRTAGESVTIDGNIGRNVYAGVNSLSVGENAVIEGTLNYVSEREGSISDAAQIGNVQFEQEEIEEDTEEKEPSAISYIYKALRVAFQTLIVTLIIVFGISKFKSLKRTNNIAMDFLKDTGKGALVLIFVPIISILLMISVIGLGFGFVILAMYIIALYIATSIVAVEIAQRILSKSQENEVKKGKMIGVSVLISLIIWAIKFIPVLGGIIGFIVLLVGLGIIASLIFQKNKKEKVNEN